MGPGSESYRNQLIRIAAESDSLRINFPDPVPPSEVLQAISAFADVGVIPYEPEGISHQYCCPNKLGQFMACGVPILANDTVHVAEMVERSNGGYCLDFSDREGFVERVIELAASYELRRALGNNGRRFHEISYNFQVSSVEFYRALDATVREARLRCVRLTAELPPDGAQPMAVFGESACQSSAHLQTVKEYQSPSLATSDIKASIRERVVRAVSRLSFIALSKLAPAHARLPSPLKKLMRPITAIVLKFLPGRVKPAVIRAYEHEWEMQAEKNA